MLDPAPICYNLLQTDNTPFAIPPDDILERKEALNEKAFRNH